MKNHAILWCVTNRKKNLKFIIEQYERYCRYIGNEKYLSFYKYSVLIERFTDIIHLAYVFLL